MYMEPSIAIDGPGTCSPDYMLFAAVGGNVTVSGAIQADEGASVKHLHTGDSRARGPCRDGFQAILGISIRSCHTQLIPPIISAPWKRTRSHPRLNNPRMLLVGQAEMRCRAEYIRSEMFETRKDVKSKRKSHEGKLKSDHISRRKWGEIDVTLYNICVSLSVCI